jgi:hypothetical protein
MYDQVSSLDLLECGLESAEQSVGKVRHETNCIQEERLRQG